ncbi:hypothetical protein IQ255_28700 [Pleurocapsales cyanobacterium LEGE 10410]|nr:hypothetical protein [Pleurocapsales cyanobacterium LEGE 10410]
MKYLPVVIIIVIFFSNFGCYENSLSEEQINYDLLPELSITIVNEIRESEEFMPGRLQKLIVTKDGSLIVSDWGNMSIVQFNNDGSFKRIIAEEGNGPGELKTFFTIFDSRRDTLLVGYAGISEQKDIFIHQEIENSYFYNHTVSEEIVNRSLITIMETAPGFGYFARIEDPISNRSENLFNPPIFKSEVLVVVDATGEVISDTLHVLKAPSTVFIEAENGAVTPIGTPPFRSRDQIKYLKEGKYLIARSADGKIQIFDKNHNLLEEIVLDVKKRPISEIDLDYQLRNLPEQFHDELKNRAPGTKPVFTDAWGSEDHFLLQLDNSERGSKMVLINRDGEPVGKFNLSQFDMVQKLKDRRIYTLHKDQESGHSIRIYEVII